MHDRRAMLRAKRGAPFLWCAGEDGTFIAWLDVRAPGRREALASTVMSMFPHAFTWEGAELIACGDVAAALARCT